MQNNSTEKLKNRVMKLLEDSKAEEVELINLKGKADFADYMIIASARSSRHAGSIADQIVDGIQETEDFPIQVEGLPAGDWVLIDLGNIIVNIFKPGIREIYNLEKMWKI